MLLDYLISVNVQGHLAAIGLLELLALQWDSGWHTPGSGLLVVGLLLCRLGVVDFANLVETLYDLLRRVLARWLTLRRG